MSNPTLTISDPETRKKITDRLIEAQKASKIADKDKTPEQKKSVDLMNKIKDQFNQADTRTSKGVRRESSQRGTPPADAYISDDEPELVDEPISINLEDDEDPKKKESEDNLELNEPEEKEEVVKKKEEPKVEKKEANPDRRRIKDAEKQLAESNKESSRLERDTLKQMQSQQAEMFNKFLNSQQIFQKQQESSRDLEVADKVIGDLIHAKNVARQQNNVDLVEDIVGRLMQAQNIKRNILHQQKTLNDEATQIIQQQAQAKEQPKQAAQAETVKNMVNLIKDWASDKPFNVVEKDGDYFPQDRNSKRAIGEIKTLVNEGWQVTDDDFFEELDDRLQSKLPSWYEEETPEPKKAEVKRAKPTVAGGGEGGESSARALPGKININDIRDRGIRQMIRNIRDKQGEAAAAAFIKTHLLKGNN